MINDKVIIADSGQKGFLLALMASALFVAIGISVMLFGAATGYPRSGFDRFMIVLVGFVAIVAGSAGGYIVLRPS
jgi:predicted anti-sigma-YlaC factor YlaD